MAEPFFERIHLTRQLGDAHRAVTNEPCNQHDWQTCSQTEYDRHQPVQTARQRQRDINHRQEIDQTVRAERNREENTQDKRPKPTLFAIGVLKELADSVVVLMVMMSAEK